MAAGGGVKTLAHMLGSANEILPALFSRSMDSTNSKKTKVHATQYS
jgi:hypothetical protein